MNIILKKKKLKELSEYLIVLFIIIATDTLWFRHSFRPLNYYVINVFGFLALIQILANRKMKRIYIPLFLMIISIALAQIINKSIDMLGIYKIAVIFLGISLAKKIPFYKFVEKFVKIIVLLALISLICILGKNAITSVFNLKTINNGSIEFYTLYIMNFYKNIYGGFIERNVGAFWEPGAYQAYLIIGIIFLNFVLKNQKNLFIKNIILIFTIFSTMSTTGIICLALVGLALVFNQKRKGPLFKFIVLILLMIIIVLIFGNEYIQQILFTKFNSQSANYISYSTRLNAILNEFIIILKSPLIGVGITKYQVIYENIALKYFMDPVTTATSLASWSMFGFIYFLIFNWSYIRIAKNISNKNISFILICIILIIILNTENWCFSILFNILAVYGIFIDKNESTTNKKNIQ